MQLVTNKISVSLRKTIIARLSLGAVRILGGTFAVREKRSNGEFLAKLAGKCSDLEEALVKDQISEDDARGEFMRAFGRKMESMTDGEYAAKARRAEYFAAIPAKKLRAMTANDWEEAATRAETSATQLVDY